MNENKNGILVKKYLVVDDNTFYEKDKVSFDYYNEETKEIDHVKCEIKAISDRISNVILGKDIEINELLNKEHPYKMFYVKNMSNLNHIVD